MKSINSMISGVGKMLKKCLAAVPGSLAAAMVLAGCATQPPPQLHSPGFLAGLLHGFVVLASLVSSLFLHIRIYAFPNSGFWYDMGFVIGFSLNIVLMVSLSIPRIGGFITRGH